MSRARRRTTRIFAGLLLAGAVSLVATLPTGCRDEEDPNYWLGKMSDVVWRDQALTNLERLYSKQVRDANNDRNAPEVQQFVKNVGGELIKQYQAMGSSGGTEDIMNMNKIVALLSQMDSPDALPVYQAALGDISGTKIARANTAAQAIGRFCISSKAHAEYIPTKAEQTPEWRAKCTKAVDTVEVLLAAIDAINEQRQDRGENAENTPEEDALAQSIVSAVGNILLGNPQIPQRDAIIDKLISVVETPDTQQDLRINFQAINMLGKIGDNRAIPALVKALFVKGRRRPVALQEVVRPALFQMEDLNLVADAMVEVGRMQNKAVNDMQREAPSNEFDLRIIPEQVSVTLGMLGISSPTVLEYLQSELNHLEFDDVDNAPGRGRTITKEMSAAFRRSWAAQALAKLHHEPTLPVLIERMSVTKRGDSVDYDWEHLAEEEIAGYIDALGDFGEPAKTNEVILPFALWADQARLDRAGRRLGLQAGPELATKLQKRGEQFEECDDEMRQRGCLRDNFLKLYVPAMLSGRDCNTVECLAKQLSHDQAFMRERAAFQLGMLSRGDEAKQGVSRAALLKQIGVERSQELMVALVNAMDEVSPNGCDQACLDALQARIDAIGARGSMKAARRFLIGLQGRLAYRARRSN